MAKKNKIVVHLECTECPVGALRNYTFKISAKRKFPKLQLRKYCRKERRHTLHKETK